MKILIRTILIITLLSGAFLGAGSPGAASRAKAHPLLAQVALGEPGKLVEVIVQKTDSSPQADRLAERLGARVTAQLGIINSFAAEMEASQALRLASDPAVRWVSLDAHVERSGLVAAPRPTDPKRPRATAEPTAAPTASPTALPTATPTPAPITTSQSYCRMGLYTGAESVASYQNFYLDTLGVRAVWGMEANGAPITGQGIGVAVVDSGISADNDFLTSDGTGSRLVASVSFGHEGTVLNDTFGHGTHVAGIIAGSGADSLGFYSGVAPGANLISLKLGGETGMVSEADVVQALQWIYDHRLEYNIRVVNLSINSTVEQSYQTSPLDAAAEILWFNGIVVVAAAGNKGPAGTYNTANAAPANDPFILTVGASDEKGNPTRLDDTLAAFSAQGKTVDGYVKPDILAPGTEIVSVLAQGSDWAAMGSERIVNGQYFRVSGTSMSAPIVSGAVALLLQAEPNLTPDQVKYRLIHTASAQAGMPYLDVYAAVTLKTMESANDGVTPSQLLWTGPNPVQWEAVAWNAVAWNAVAWNAVSWNAVSWNAVAWNGRR